MSDLLVTFLRDEIADLLDDEIARRESVGSVTRSGSHELVVVDEDDNRFLVTVTYAGLGQ